MGFDTLRFGHKYLFERGGRAGLRDSARTMSSRPPPATTSALTASLPASWRSSPAAERTTGALPRLARSTWGGLTGSGCGNQTCKQLRRCRASRYLLWYACPDTIRTHSLRGIHRF